MQEGVGLRKTKYNLKHRFSIGCDDFWELYQETNTFLCCFWYEY